MGVQDLVLRAHSRPLSLAILSATGVIAASRLHLLYAPGTRRQKQRKLTTKLLSSQGCARNASRLYAASSIALMASGGTSW